MLSHEGYVFPSARSSTRPMSENTLNAAFRRMGQELKPARIRLNVVDRRQLTQWAKNA